MAKIKKVTHGRHEGKIVLKKGIVDGIVYLAISELPHVSFVSTKPFDKLTGYDDIKITNNANSIIVDVSVKIYYTQSVSDIAFKIQEAIRHNVEIMTDYHVAAVNVYVKGVVFEDLPSHKIEIEGYKSVEGNEKSSENSTNGTLSEPVSEKTTKKENTISDEAKQ